MVQVTLPFGALNKIPGVSGIDDVTLDIPTPQEVEDAVDAALEESDSARADIIQQLNDDIAGWGDLVERGLSDALFDQGFETTEPSALLDDIAGAIAVEVDIEGVTSDDIIAAVLEALDVDDGDIVLEIEGSLFSIEDDFVDLLVEAIEEADLAGDGTDEGGLPFPDLPGGDILDNLSDIQDTLDGLEIPGVDEFADAAGDALVDALNDLPGSDLLTDPDAFLDSLTDSVVEALVSEDASQNLQDTLDNR